MDKTSDFITTISNGYNSVGSTIYLGSGVYNGIADKEIKVQIPLSTLNRHGLITGATGTGKTKTLQHICEMLSEKSVPVMIMDIKGDVSGLTQKGDTNAQIEKRLENMQFDWKSNSYPVEFLSISNEDGVRMRATVSEFGPILFSKILELNETQQSVLSVIFKYADDKRLPLVDLKDIKKLIQYISNEGKDEFVSEYGSVSTASTGLIIRKIIEIEDQGANIFFGEKSFDVEDLMKIDERGYGYINILRLATLQAQPKMFSTFMLSLLAEVFQKFPEVGDIDQPKLVLVIDEAHLIFKEASKSLLSQLETVIKLIRSKGVGIIFCTQSPSDIPKDILGQLGLKIQHALRAFTAQDRKAITLISENFPITKFYNTEELITSLGIGEALVTALNEKGEPTPLIHTIIAPPQSRMDVISVEEMRQTIAKSSLYQKYSEVIDSESAHEILSSKMTKYLQEQTDVQNKSSEKTESQTPKQSGTNVFGGLSKDPFVKSMAKSATTSFVRNLTGQLTRGILGSLFKK